MNKRSISRRNFLQVSAGAAALSAANSSGMRSASPPDAAPGVKSDAPMRTPGTSAEFAMAEDWMRAFSAPSPGVKPAAHTGLFPEALKPPFSFDYGNSKSADLLPEWKVEVKVAGADNAKQEHQVTFTDPGTGLEVRISATVFKNFPAVEWVLYFRNRGGVDTPILENVHALDAPLLCAEGDPIIHYAKGSGCKLKAFSD